MSSPRGSHREMSSVLTSPAKVRPAFWRPLEASVWSKRAQLWWKTWTSASPSPRSGPKKKPPANRPDAVVWEQLEQSAGEETRLSITYLCFMIVATMIAGIGVMLDQPILIVGAMVVGPEFG